MYLSADATFILVSARVQVSPRLFKQGCQMVSFQTKNPNLGKFLEGLRLENVDIFAAVWNILPTAGIFYDHLVHFVFI
jgi:hypothetical protein